MTESLKKYENCLPGFCPLYDACKKLSDIDSIELCTGFIIGTIDNLLDLLENPDLEAKHRASYEKTVAELKATLTYIQAWDFWEDK